MSTYSFPGTAGSTVTSISAYQSNRKRTHHELTTAARLHKVRRAFLCYNNMKNVYQLYFFSISAEYSEKIRWILSLLFGKRFIYSSTHKKFTEISTIARKQKISTRVMIQRFWSFSQFFFLLPQVRLCKYV